MMNKYGFEGKGLFEDDFTSIKHPKKNKSALDLVKDVVGEVYCSCFGAGLGTYWNCVWEVSVCVAFGLNPHLALYVIGIDADSFKDLDDVHLYAIGAIKDCKSMYRKPCGCFEAIEIQDYLK